MSSALKGIKVLDFTQIAAGPTCSQMLADMGADVIKIESESGDPCRAFPPYVGKESSFFLALNSGKRSVVLDLKQQAHAELARKLASDSDVLLESFRPGVMARLGLGHEAVSALNPRIVYCSISGFGQSGPWRDLPGVDGVLQALTGLMSIGSAPQGAPTKLPVPLVDIVTGHMATIAVLAALNQRACTEVGQRLDVDMFSSAVALQQSAFASYFATQEVPSSLGSAAPYSAPNEALRCADGWIMLAAYQPERWRTLCRVLGAPEMADLPQFSTLDARLTNRLELVERLESLMQSKPAAEWEVIFREADLICGQILDYAQVASSPQFEALGLKELVDHPASGPVAVARFNLGSGSRPTPTRRAAPRLGEHTDAVISELLARFERTEPQPSETLDHEYQAGS
ncbi:carnitine dehydratase [Variovorax sp. WS11]|nr:CoA transferase [Variovorax sp. WS11]PSL86155.1 carnitine dehydratase [Variovorax sp. WS11]